MRDIEYISKTFKRYGGMMRTQQLYSEKIYYSV